MRFVLSPHFTCPCLPPSLCTCLECCRISGHQPHGKTEQMFLLQTFSFFLGHNCLFHIKNKTSKRKWKTIFIFVHYSLHSNTKSTGVYCVVAASSKDFVVLPLLFLLSAHFLSSLDLIYADKMKKLDFQRKCIFAFTLM